MFLKIVVLKNLEKSIGKHLCWSLFLIKLPAFSPATSLKRDSSTAVFLRIFKNTFFTEHLWTTPYDYT